MSFPPAAAQINKNSAAAGASRMRFSQLLLGVDPSQQRRLAMVLMSALMYLVCILVLGYGTAIGIFGGTRVNVLAALCGAAAVLFYILVRSGWNLRCAEPSLALAQGLVAQTLIAYAYAVSGPIHPSALILLALVMFFAMFDMGVTKVRLLMVYTIVLMGGVMWWRSQADPLAYPARLELIYFVSVATVLPAISSLAVHTSNMRMRLRSQKAELERALAQLHELATHDELTGLVNRRYMTEVLNQQALRRARGGPGFAVAIADIDHFKNVNDSFGHRCGDEALRTFAREAQAHLRASDIIARWGGEEFLMLLPDTPPGDPNLAVERLRAALADVVASAHAPELRLAFSTGLTVHAEGEPIEDTIERADRALYAAKQAGRNRTCRL